MFPEAADVKHADKNRIKIRVTLEWRSRPSACIRNALDFKHHIFTFERHTRRRIESESDSRAQVLAEDGRIRRIIPPFGWESRWEGRRSPQEWIERSLFEPGRSSLRHRLDFPSTIAQEQLFIYRRMCVSKPTLMRVIDSLYQSSRVLFLQTQRQK